ncbi:hypothetical protein BGY98DRAFT_149626 [Russula aff. rugulosa BPL654]|nr:hypothetical protein BGY98DRAFT_149626 [Russula aff. rugulosa BPL654]
MSSAFAIASEASRGIYFNYRNGVQIGKPVRHKLRRLLYCRKLFILSLLANGSFVPEQRVKYSVLVICCEPMIQPIEFRPNGIGVLYCVWIICKTAVIRMTCRVYSHVLVLGMDPSRAIYIELLDAIRSFNHRGARGIAWLCPTCAMLSARA